MAMNDPVRDHRLSAGGAECQDRRADRRLRRARHGRYEGRRLYRHREYSRSIWKRARSGCTPRRPWSRTWCSWALPSRKARQPLTHNNTKGMVRAFDVRTGKMLWTFHTIPKKGEFGYDTWLNDSADINGNTGVWTGITVDHRTRHRLSAGRGSDQRLLWRRTAGQQSLRRQPGVRRSEDRQAQVVLPDRPSPDVGLRSLFAADARRHHRGRPRDQGRGACPARNRSSMYLIA